jgi:tRNA threonylcarbamoyladenosine biosynthesis protein TsaB
MRILALETSTQRGDVALLSSRHLVANGRLAADEMSSKMLVPTIHRLLSEANWRPDELELVAVGTGPGSFTGLRIGVMVAKTLAYTVGAEIVSVDTLRAIASHSKIESEPVWVVLDAQRKQLFSQPFQCEVGGDPIATEQRQLIDAEQWLSQLSEGQRITGPGLIKLQDRLPSFAALVDQTLWTPAAETVGRLALADYERGHRDDRWSLTPDYGRSSAAEEKLGRVQRRR